MNSHGFDAFIFKRALLFLLIIPLSFNVSTATSQYSNDPIARTLGPCGDTSGLYRTIMEVQGSGFASPFMKSRKKNKRVIVEGIVTLERQGREAGSSREMKGGKKDSEYSGFWLQQSDEITLDPIISMNSKRPSRGIFIFHSKYRVKQGQVIRLLGQVDEYQTLTEIKKIEAIKVCRNTQASVADDLPKPIPLTLPVASLKELESLEGMRVQLPQPLIVSDLYGTGYGFGNYGQFAISSMLHFQPTELMSAAEVLKRSAILTKKEKDYLLVDDGTAQLYPRTIPFPNKFGFSANNSLRIGDVLTAGTIGILHAYKPHYILIPEIDLRKKDLRIQPASWNKMPVINTQSNLVIASMNVGNYFNGNGRVNGHKLSNKTRGFPTSRGAKTYSGFKLQREKIVSALNTINADIIALMELENDGYGPNSAISDLTQRLNKTFKPELHYQYVIPNKQDLSKGKLGHSAISVGILYRKNKVKLASEVKVLNAKNARNLRTDVKFNDRLHRPSLIQEFERSGKKIIIAVNHLKSKGKRCKSDNYKNQRTLQEKGDVLQGNCNQVRKNAAMSLTQFIEKQFDTRKNNLLIIGDLNSYSQEDPLLALYDAGYKNLNAVARTFSYSHQGYLGNLDHALVNKKLLPRVRSFDIWHINSVEDVLLDYRTEENGHKHPSRDHYGKPDEKRSSDHDPLIIGLEL